MFFSIYCLILYLKKEGIILASGEKVMLIDRFLDYISYETTSKEDSDTSPSTLIQLELGKHLYDELNKLGLKVMSFS